MQFFTILASLWIGGLIGIGFLVAPTLFIFLTDNFFKKNTYSP